MLFWEACGDTVGTSLADFWDALGVELATKAFNRNL